MEPSTLEAIQKMIDTQATQMRELREEHKVEMQQQRDAAEKTLHTLMTKHQEDTDKITQKLSNIQANAPSGRAGSHSMTVPQAAKYTSPPMPPAIDKDLTVSDTEPNAVKRLRRYTKASASQRHPQTFHRRHDPH